jgi:hypothetical protein
MAHAQLNGGWLKNIQKIAEILKAANLETTTL